MVKLNPLDVIATHLQQGGALIHRNSTFILVHQGTVAVGATLHELALTLSAINGESPRRGPSIAIWLSPLLLQQFGGVRRKAESLSSFIRDAMRREIHRRLGGDHADP